VNFNLGWLDLSIEGALRYEHIIYVISLGSDIKYKIELPQFLSSFWAISILAFFHPYGG
jgi:hypothetical protein